MFIKYSKTKLKNGFEIYHIPVSKGSGVISVDVFYRVGSRNETMGKSGIAHMLEHLNFKSTKNMKAGEFDRIVKSFGGKNNASTGFDYTHYFVKCSKGNLNEALRLYADIMENLSLKDKEFRPERDVVTEERRWRTDIRSWSIEDIKEFHETYYQPQNALLLITGDIDKKSAFELGKKHFERIKNKKPIPKPHCVEPVQNGAKRAEIYKDSEVEMLALAFKIPPFNHEDQPALGALAEYLGSGQSSVLQRVLIDEKCLVNSVYVYNMDNIDESLFIVLAVCNPGIKAEAVEEEIWRVIKETKTQKIDEDEITKTKNNLKSHLIYSLDNTTRMANLYGSYLVKGDIKPLFELPEKTTALKPADISEICKKYIRKEKSTTIILRKEKSE